MAKAVSKPAARRKAAEPAVKQVAKRQVAEVVAKPVAKHKVAKAVAKPVKTRRKAESVVAAEVELTAAVPAAEFALAAEFASTAELTIEQWIAEQAAELAREHEAAEPAFRPVAEQWAAEPVADVPVAEPVAEPIVERGTTYLPAEVIAEQVAAAAAPVAEPDASDSLFKPFVERRTTIKSLLERRLADPSAKERRKSDSLARECAANAAAQAPSLAAAAKERRIAAAAAAAREGGAAEPAAEPFVERRVADRRADRGGESVESEFRVREQQNLFNETALWMRKGGTALLGMNLLIAIAVLVLWHARSSQTPELSEMQKATMAEMRRATAASEVAAYASCLGSQTAQSILSQMKAGGAGSRIAPNGNGVPATAAARAQAAQIEFDVEKSTSVNVHVPVLFHLGIENIGKSSALNTKVWGAVKVVDSGKEPDFKYDEVALSKAAISATDPTAKLVLYSADDAGMVVPLNDATFERVSSGSAYVVAYGKVVYEDIFGTRHWAVFCHNITEPAGAGKHFNKCSSYNSSGVSEVAGQSIQASIAPSVPNAPQSAAMTLPEIACQLPKQEKN